MEKTQDYRGRKKIYDVYTKQIRDVYPSPIERGLFRTYYLCPVCNTELDKETYDVGVLTICSECEYEYFDISLDIDLNGIREVNRIIEEFDEEKAEKIENKKQWKIEGINEDQQDFSTVVDAGSAYEAETKAINAGVNGRRVYAILEVISKEVKKRNGEQS